MIKLTNVKIPYKVPDNEYVVYVAKKLKVPSGDIMSCTLMKKSLDARRKNDIHYVCTFKIRAKNEPILIKYSKDTAVRYNENEYVFPYTDMVSDEKIIIVGSGPAGLFCALCMARAGLNPIIIEQGECVDERQTSIEHFKITGELNLHSNIQFGEGGAGTFSDGKLTCGVNDERMSFVLREFASHGAPNDIITNSKPHIGTDYLMPTVRNIREEIISHGGNFIFNTKMTDIDISGNSVKGINTVNIKTGKETYFRCNRLICAIGHSSRDTYEMMYSKGFAMERKPFSVGVRIEHRREYINKLQYKDVFSDDTLPTADYKLSCHLDTGSAYTFCMCPGGEVVCGASEANAIVTNGMSRYKRDDDNSNAALLVGITPDDIPGSDILGGIYFQRELEQKAYNLGGGRYYAPCQRVEDFISDIPSKFIGTVNPSYKPGVKLCNLNDILPEFVAMTLKKALIEFDRKMPGFNLPDAILTGVETRSSAPLRILRDEKYESNIKNIYPIGEGAGYAGGIMSSAVDGIKCAEKLCSIIQTFMHINQQSIHIQNR